MPDLTDRLCARLQTAEDQLTQQSTQPTGDASPSAPPLAAEPWSFSQPLSQARPDTSQKPFSVHIKPREPPVFTGEKGQDVVSWLRTVEDYLEFVTCSERQAIAYVILLLSGNARIWWDSEFLSRGNKRPESIEEFKLLLRPSLSPLFGSNGPGLSSSHWHRKRGKMRSPTWPAPNPCCIECRATT